MFRHIPNLERSLVKMNPLSSADQQIVFFLFFALYFSLASTRIIPMNNGNYLTPAFELSLKVYNKVFRLANSVNMTADQQQEYNDILAEQPQVVADKLKNALNIDVDPQSVGQIGLFFLKGMSSLFVTHNELKGRRKVRTLYYFVFFAKENSKSKRFVDFTWTV